MLQSRRQFLIGAGAVLAFPRDLAMLIDADAALLAGLTARGRRLVREVMADYPTLSLAKCIEMLSDGGM